MSYPDPYDLDIFIRVAEAGSVTRAAQEMFISQPAVTQRLRRLERVLGTRLLERRGRGVGLTDGGRAILPLVQQMLDTLKRIPVTISEVEGLLRGEIVLGASTTIGEFVLPTRLPAFTRVYPHITVRLQIANTQEVIQRVLAHSLHVGFVGLRPDHTPLLATPFLDDEIVLVAAASHALAGCKVSPQQLVDERLLLREEGSATRVLAMKALGRCGVNTKEAVGFGSNAAVRTAVLAGYGVAALSREVVANDLADGRLMLVRLPGWRCRRRFYVIHRRDVMLSKAERILLDFLRQEEVQSQ